MAKRCYSDEERAACLAALAANAGNVGKTARQCGVPEDTLRSWARGHRHPEALQMSGEKKKLLADRLEELAHKLAGVSDRKADDLNAKDALIALGVAVDKMLLLRGEPTEITERRNYDLDRLSDEDLTNLDRLASAARRP